MKNKSYKTSVFTNLANTVEKAVKSLFAPVDTEKLAVIQIHSMTSQMF